jgi:hypothetical protein
MIYGLHTTFIELIENKSSDEQNAISTVASIQSAPNIMTEFITLIAMSLVRS